MIKLNNVMTISASAIKEIGADRYMRIIRIKDIVHGDVEVSLFADHCTALSTTTIEAEHWRTQAAVESARADAAETELARLRQAIDRIAQGKDA